MHEGFYVESDCRESFVYVHTYVNILHAFRQGFASFERTQILSGIQFTKHFIEFVLCGENQLFGSNINVIYTLKTCGQRSSTSESKCQAIVLSCSCANMLGVAGCHATT